MHRTCLAARSVTFFITPEISYRPFNARLPSLVRHSSTKPPPSHPTSMTTPSRTPQPSPSSPTEQSSTPSTADLLSRISHLESLLRTTTAQLQATLSPSSSSQTPSTIKAQSPPRRKKPPRPFTASRFSTRLIALKLSYLGSSYNGFEHANGTVTPKPTVEEVLWKALRKTRLIGPEIQEECDESFDVVWGEGERERVYGLGSFSNSNHDVGESGKRRGLKLDVNWEGCEYSKCGRTDKGVSAFGQVVGLRVRSNRPLPKKTSGSEEAVNGDGIIAQEISSSGNMNGIQDTPMPELSFQDLPDSFTSEPPFDDIASELPYISLLNAVLPLTIRILAWCPHPPDGFDARFSCRERRYKYFFTSPAFLPTPGPIGMKFADGRESETREGWLDIDKMREAATKLVGTKDYRNLCKIDSSKQMSSCVRRVSYAGIEEWGASGQELTRSEHLGPDGMPGTASMARRMGIGEFVDEGLRVYTFTVHGSAFLWHQVRCMVGVLFLVGQGLEEPSVIDDLLDVERNSRKPLYEMADDAPLVLWDCIFSDEENSGKDALDWVYAGDERSIPSLTTKNDGKFGLGGVASVMWNQWRKAKMDEVLAGSLLDLALSQGDGSALRRGGFREPATASRSQKIFDGGDNAKVAGAYIPIMQKPKMQTLEEQNEKYLNGRKIRRDARVMPDVEDDQ